MPKVALGSLMCSAAAQQQLLLACALSVVQK